MTPKEKKARKIQRVAEKLVDALIAYCEAHVAAYEGQRMDDKTIALVGLLLRELVTHHKFDGERMRAAAEWVYKCTPEGL